MMVPDLRSVSNQMMTSLVLKIAPALMNSSVPYRTQTTILHSESQAVQNMVLMNETTLQPAQTVPRAQRRKKQWKLSALGLLGNQGWRSRPGLISPGMPME